MQTHIAHLQQAVKITTKYTQPKDYVQPDFATILAMTLQVVQAIKEDNDKKGGRK
jgi:hypothetical protein